MSDVEADVVIIGSGPTGGAAAWRLASAGLDVVCLERGGWFPYEKIDREGPDWERRREQEFNSNPNIRRGAADYPIDDNETPIKPMIGNNVGGGSIYWSAHVPRFKPEDFRVQTLDGVGDDWPINYEDLVPHYTLAEARWGVAAMNGDPSAAPLADGCMTLPTIAAHGRRLAEALDRRGWHWWPVNLVVGKDGDDHGTQHCTHVGPCDVGCPSRIRSGADRAFVGEAIAAGARLMANTAVLRLEHDSSGQVVAAVCSGECGVFRVRGSRFILAANGIGTPRLLLLSASAMFPNGLANSSGMVGRNLMLHPYARVDGLFADCLGAWVSGEKAGIVSFEFYATRAGHDFIRGFKLQLTGGPGPLGTALGTATGQRIGWGERHHAEFEAHFDHICGFTVCAEDLAHPDNRIVLSQMEIDADGLPIARMIYRLSDNSRRILDFGMDRADELLRDAGAIATYRTPLTTQAGFHLMGTARMGNDPETSVVDAFGRCHDVPNLFVADASAFVTSAAVNPTLTAQALALRSAEHIISTLA
ncbi:GMC family oxidoreductase [Mesorhizobium sp. WSM4887]|uniref:GMC family oxidoreductase n=1 Tax=Mesorhizobium sp. WSM4887 TaxID=3038543 RepID=UPI0024163F07|nr:GMC family oxidoreductase [Mesorhizobium sp. WSM4887]MDG4889781.1 GMC family oxidoreductase [Mesorhizobium sp. WSM4887]